MEDSKKQPTEIQERLQIAKESIKSKLDKFNSRKKHGQKKVNKNKSTILRLMPEDLVNKNVDHIFDVREDGKLHKLHIVDLSQELQKNKDPMQTPFEIVYDSVYNYDGNSDNDWEPNEDDTYEYALLQNYHERNLIILNYAFLKQYIVNMWNRYTATQ